MVFWARISGHSEYFLDYNDGLTSSNSSFGGESEIDMKFHLDRVQLEPMDILNTLWDD